MLSTEHSRPTTPFQLDKAGCYGPPDYQVLSEEEIGRELKALARPQKFKLQAGVVVDALNFQPSLQSRTQDRYALRQFKVGKETWTVSGVFDGHLGDVTVEHVSHHLPIIVEETLQKMYSTDPASITQPAGVSRALSQAIQAFDEAIASDVLDLFGGLSGLAQRSDEEVRQIINDQHSGGKNFAKVRLNMYGTTAIIALTDEKKENLWVSSVGDCQAVLVQSEPGKDGKVAELLTTENNGNNPREIERVRREHPGEPDCVVNERVLGALAPFRCLGDTAFKQPPEFTRRILYNLLPRLPDVSPWEEFLRRNITPPYISAEPEVVHRVLSTSTSPIPQTYIVLASDGFGDLCQSVELCSAWVRTRTTPSKETNTALELLRLALGGEDLHTVSRFITMDTPETSWLDDTTILVQTLN